MLKLLLISLLISVLFSGCSTSIVEPWECECRSTNDTVLKCRGVRGEVVSPIWD